MDLAAELREHVCQYVAGDEPLLRLREWLEAHDDVSASTDETLRDLNADAWAVISEMDCLELDEARAREILRASLREERCDMDDTGRRLAAVAE